MNTDLNFFKKNGYLIKENLITQKTINKINKIVHEVLSEEKKKIKKKIQMELNHMIIIILFTTQMAHKIKRF